MRAEGAGGAAAATTRGRVDFGHAGATIRTGPLALRLRARAVAVGVALGALALGLAVFAIGIGDFPLSPGKIVDVTLGRGASFHRMIVLEWRSPIALAALVFGALLGVGGAIFQSLTRNPLGSPDIIGFDAGSYTAVVVTMLVLGTRDFATLAGASLTGGLVTALLVYVLAWRGGVQGFRLIVVGIGVSAALGSLNAYLITRADIEDALAVGFWGAGSLSRVTWGSMLPAGVVAAIVIVLALALSPALSQLELGDDAAVSHGVRAGRARLLLIVTGVATSALVTAAAGPIGFIALVAPQLARRLARSPGVSILGAAAMGAFLLTAAHVLGLLVAQAYRQVPVGLITVILGGGYLIWLLINETRRSL